MFSPYKIPVFSANFLWFIAVLFLYSFTSFAQPACNASTTLNCNDDGAGTDFLMSTATNQVFTFDSFGMFMGGITRSGATNLKLTITESAMATDDCRWQLHANVDNNGWAFNNEWELLTAYAATGTAAPLDMLQLKVRNECNTPLPGVQVFSSIATTAGTFPIVENAAGTSNEPGTCSGLNVNRPGSYLDITNYGEYHFAIDYRVIPVLGMQPGVYEVTVRYCLSEGP